MDLEGESGGVVGALLRLRRVNNDEEVAEDNDVDEDVCARVGYTRRSTTEMQGFFDPQVLWVLCAKSRMRREADAPHEWGHCNGGYVQSTSV